MKQPYFLKRYKHINPHTFNVKKKQPHQAGSQMADGIVEFTSVKCLLKYNMWKLQDTQFKYQKTISGQHYLSLAKSRWCNWLASQSLQGYYHSRLCRRREHKIHNLSKPHPMMDVEQAQTAEAC